MRLRVTRGQQARQAATDASTTFRSKSDWRDRAPQRRRRSACACILGDEAHVTASVSPRAASSAARARVRASALSSARRLVTPCMRGNGVAGMRSSPAMRTTSSTRSAAPCMSGRHVGTVTVAALEPCLRSCSRAPSRIDLISASSTVHARSASRRARNRKRSRAVRIGSLPATLAFGRLCRRRTSGSCRSRDRGPGATEAGSTPRSKR